MGNLTAEAQRDADWKKKTSFLTKRSHPPLRPAAGFSAREEDKQANCLSRFPGPAIPSDRDFFAVVAFDPHTDTGITRIFAGMAPEPLGLRAFPEALVQSIEIAEQRLRLGMVFASTRF